MAQTKVDDVVGQLLTEILSRSCGNGRSFASEWLLVQRFGCSRLTIREACERLVGRGVVLKQAGEKLWIVSERNWPLELFGDELIVRRDSPDSPALIDDLIAFQRRNLVAVAQTAAERRTDSDLYALDLGLYEFERGAERNDDHLIRRHEGELFEALIDSAHSRSLTACANTGNRLMHQLGVLRPPGLPWVSVEAWRTLIDAIRAGQPGVASGLAATMFENLFSTLRRVYLRQPEPRLERPEAAGEAPVLENEHWMGPEGRVRYRARGASLDAAFSEWVDPAEVLVGDDTPVSTGDGRDEGGDVDTAVESAAPPDP